MPAPAGVSEQLADARTPRSAAWPSTTRPCSTSTAACRSWATSPPTSAADLAAYLAGVEVDPARLAWVQQRRAELARLQRKYGDTIDEVLAWAKESAARLDELEGADDRAARARGAGWRRCAASSPRRRRTLSAARRKAAVTFGKRVTTELSHLAMGKAVVQAALGRRPDPDGLVLPGAAEPVRFTRHGVDDVEIRARGQSGRPGTQRRQGGIRR